MLHRCDVPRCCNPKHLYVGTHRQNWCDAVKAGTAYKFEVKKGIDVHCAKLTIEQVRFIRSSELGHTELAGMFGVSKQAVYRLRKGLSWKSII